MPIDFQCPSCSKQYRVADTNAGKRFACKECGNPIQVPAEVSAPPAASQVAAPPAARVCPVVHDLPVRAAPTGSLNMPGP